MVIMRRPDTLIEEEVTYESRPVIDRRVSDDCQYDGYNLPSVPQYERLVVPTYHSLSPIVLGGREHHYVHGHGDKQIREAFSKAYITPWGIPRTGIKIIQKEQALRYSHATYVRCSIFASNTGLYNH